MKQQILYLCLMETKEIYLAAGCFWGAEHYLKRIRGVVKTETGYANGNIAYPTYREVYTDTTGYAETVRVVYDPDVLGLERLIQIYFSAIDPTSLNKQGGDEGTRYRTGIYYQDPAKRRPGWPWKSSPSRISTGPSPSTRTTWTSIRRDTATSPPP